MPRWLAGAGSLALVAVAVWWLAGRGAFGGLSDVIRSRPANILLVTLDTLRADRLGSYGYPAARTPSLDRLAARGLRFADVSSVASLTLPAHTSLMTGTFPAWHGVKDNGGFYVGDEQVTLAEILRERGYRTGGFVGAFVLDGRWGLQQGFDHYFDRFDLSQADGTGMDAIQRRGDAVVDAAVEWLDRDTAAAFFCWVHLYDPHTPYDAPAPYRAGYPATISGAYDAEIAFTDAQVGRLLDHLAATRRLDRTLVVALGDHGESLGAHREQTHGFFIYESTLRIPLLVAGPRVEPGVVRDPVRIVDVAPTILELVGVPVPRPVQGRSLVAAARGERLNLPVFAESWFPRYHYGWSELIAMRDGHYKFILAPRRELYDLETDPGETRNLAGEQPDRAAAAERALVAFLARTRRAGSATGPVRMDDDVEERLRALGYVGGSTSRRALEDRPRRDPKDTIVLYSLLKTAGQLSVGGRLDEAIARVQEALAADPEIVEAHTMMGNLHTKMGDHAAAVEAYRRALAIDPEHDGATFSLALAYKNLGRLADAEAGFARVKQLDPRGGKAYWQLADIWMQQGQFDRAERELTRALGMKVDRPAFLVKLGECYIELGRWADAEATLTEALAERPTIARARYDLGLIREAQGQPSRAIAEYEQELASHAGDASASVNLARLLLRAGRTADAVSRLREAVAANPTHGTAHLYLAKALLDLGDLEGAAAHATDGLSARPEGAIAPLGHYVLADVYNRQGRPRDAAREVAAARSLEKGAPGQHRREEM